MTKLDIDIGYIAQLAELLQKSGLSEIEISQAETRVRVARQIHATVDIAAPTALLPAPVAGAAHAGDLGMGAGPELSHPGLVTSPMVGTAYLASEPGATPFVAVGQEVREGATLLIIEAMKVMNQIRAPRSGRVIKIFIENATPVEFGEPLLIIE
jgi:acetyl-CoA carboxylase biotin carboxyl carrier protein